MKTADICDFLHLQILKSRHIYGKMNIQKLEVFRLQGGFTHP